MFQLLYERLAHIKENERQVHISVQRAKAHKPAIDLKLADKSPSEFFTDTSPTANYYQQMLKRFEDQIRNEDDMVHIEETLRRFYMAHGWGLYNFDRILIAIIRFAGQVVASDNKDKSNEIISLFYKNRKDHETTHQNELEYRKSVEKLVRDGDIYRFEYNTTTQCATVQIFKKDDKTFDVETMGAQARWQYYVSSFVMRDWTEGVPHNIRWPFLRRNLPKDLETAEDYSQVYLPQWNEDGLVVRIALNSYHLLYDPETFDWWVHDDKVRIRGLKGLKEFIEERNRRFEMKFVEKAPWKNGMTPNEIDETLSGFTKWYGNTVDAAPVSSVDAAKFDEIMSGV